MYMCVIMTNCPNLSIMEVLTFHASLFLTLFCLFLFIPIMWQMLNYSNYLNRTTGSNVKPENYTCWGRFHIKKAAAYCSILAIFFQILQLILTFKHSVSLTNISTSVCIFIDLLEGCCIVLVFLSLSKSDERFLIPVIGLKLFLVLCWLIQTAIFFVAFIFPEASARLSVHRMSNQVSEAARLIIFIHMAAFEIWFYSIVLALYVYFHRDREGLISEPRIQLSQDNDQIPSNFVNPNFVPPFDEQ